MKELSQSLVGKWVCVTWHDAADEKQTWLTAAEIDEESIAVRSCGVVVRISPKYLTLAGDHNVQAAAPDAPIYGRVTRIPRGMVVSLKVWRE